MIPILKVCTLYLHFLEKDSKHLCMKIKLISNLIADGAWEFIAIMDKYDLKYDDLDIINNQDIYAEMLEKSGQPLSPCVEMNGVMLADVSGEEVENYMINNKLVQESTNQTSVPTNSPCSDEEHERQRTESQNSSPVRFF